MAAPSHLPYDITFSITGYLDNSVDDRRSLMALAMSSKSFLPVCQERLFSSVTLKEESSVSDSDSDAGHDSDRVGHLARILESSPHIRHYIRSLTYKSGTESNQPPSSLGLLADIIGVLPSLQELRLSLSTKFDWGCDDRVCSGESRFVKAVYDAVKRPTLLTVHLNPITNFPLTLFTSKCQELLIAEDGPSSTSLSVFKPIVEEQPSCSSSQCGTLRVRKYEVGREFWPRRMQHRVIDGVNVLDSKCPTTPSLDLRFLDHLFVKFASEENINEAKKIQELATSIKSMEVEVSRRANFADVAEFVRGSRSTLQTLTLSFTVTCHNDPWSSLSKEVNELADESLQSLERLVISTSQCSCGNIPNSQLERLDQALSGGGYPSLRDVLLIIKTSKSKHDEIDFPGTYRRYLSRLNKVKTVKLRISAEVQDD